MRSLFVAAFVVGMLATAWPAGAPASIPPWARREKRPPAYPPALVTPKWLAARLAQPGICVVDARPETSYARGHVPGALHVDAFGLAPDPGTLASRLGAAGIASLGTVVCYSDSATPVSAGRLYWLLELAGHRDARVLNGGFDAWLAAGSRAEPGRGRARPARFEAAPDTTRIADLATVMAAFGEAGRTLMDWRPFDRWATGHIPHSLPFPLERLVNRDGTLADSLHARAVFETFGPRENDAVNLDDEFIVCGDPGPREAPVHPYLAARVAGIARVRNYPEGFAGWRGHDGVPIVRVVDAREVARLLEGALAPGDDCRPPRDAMLFDLRGRPDYDTGHLPGAVLLPSYEFAAALEDTVRALWPGADRARIPLILYCYGPGCVRSRNCATLAARHGFRNLLWFRDGTFGWANAGMRLVPDRRAR